MSLAHDQLRSHLSHSRRIVIKVGSRVLVKNSGKPHLNRFSSIVEDIAALRKMSKEVVLVSSGAVGSGMERLGITKRPRNLPDLQMAAAIGQVRLLSRYDNLFAAHKCTVSQVLLTYDDLNDRKRHLNARNTFLALLRRGIVPIVNENDVVAVDEIKLGDNDVLAALVSVLIDADLLILLSTVNGLRDLERKGSSARIRCIPSITDEFKALVTPHRNEISSGGMATKLQAAQSASLSGINVVIADGRKPGIVARVIGGQDVGTLIPATPSCTELRLRARKKWISLFNRPSGSLTLDQGAVDAMCSQGRSLLAVGIKQVEGVFEQGALVN
ncbi:MAG: glutamate 5-kinase, partial [Bdellovibrionales bacterium]|nr:glutamate 5-kinase [Bdellovibrionales bacterium]